MTQRNDGGPACSKGADMSTQHTPKSWACVQNGRFLPMDGWSADHDDFTITAAAPIKAGGKVIAIVVDGRDYFDLELAEMKANAHLMAAAPDLLAALVAINERLTECAAIPASAADAYDSYFRELVRAAIAKAEGKS